MGYGHKWFPAWFQLAGGPSVISLALLAELCWVRSRLYNASMDELAAMISDLLRTPQIQVERV